MEITTRLQKELDDMNVLFDQIEKLERVQRHLEEIASVERIRRECEAQWRLIRTALDDVHRTLNHFARRIQQASGGKGKTSAKRKSSSSGGSSGDGGDGGGDSDGPARTPSKSKKPRSKPRSTSLQHPPSSLPGEIATTSPQVSPPRPLPGREIVILIILCLYGIANIVPSGILQGLIIFCLLIIALAAMGYPEVARYIWSTVPKLLKQLATDADEESEGPDEGS